MKPLLQSRRKSKVDLEAEAKNLPLFQLPIPTARSMTPEFLDSEAASPPEKKAEKQVEAQGPETGEVGVGREIGKEEEKKGKEKTPGLAGSGTKYDAEKLRWDLIPYEGLTEVVRVVTFGAGKYGPNNWRHLTCPDGRYFAAAMRHMVAWQQGERSDQESGISHLAHAACNLLFLMWFDRDRK